MCEVMFVGQKAVGKSCLTAVLSGNHPNLDYFENDVITSYVTNALYQTNTVRVNILDCPPIMDHITRQRISSRDINVIVCCFSIVDISSLNAIVDYYAKEIEEVMHCEDNIPIVLCGTQHDAIKDKDPDDCVNISMALKAANEIRTKYNLSVISYIETSSLTNNHKGEGIKELLNEILRLYCKVDQPLEKPLHTTYVVKRKDVQKKKRFSLSFSKVSNSLDETFTEYVPRDLSQFM
ncbi:hypothetical protein ABK040_002995 [Willaertia magna]